MNNPDNDLEYYLRQIDYDRRLASGSFSNDDARKALIASIRRYRDGKISQAFIIGLASAFIQDQIGEGDDNLLTVLCSIDDCKFHRQEWPETQIDSVLQHALQSLEDEGSSQL